MRHATTAARNVVSFSTLIGSFEFERVLKFNAACARAQIQMDQSEFRMKPHYERPLWHAHPCPLTLGVSLMPFKGFNPSLCHFSKFYETTLGDLAHLSKE